MNLRAHFLGSSPLSAAEEKLILHMERAIALHLRKEPSGAGRRDEYESDECCADVCAFPISNVEGD